MAFSRTKTADLLKLRNEVDNDPQGLGLAALKHDVTPLLRLLHDRTKGGGTVNRPTEELDIPEIAGVIDDGEYDGLSAMGKLWIGMFINQAADVRLRPFKAKFLSLFAAGSVTRVAVLALRSMPGSRIDILFGVNTRVDQYDWHTVMKS